MIARLLPKDFDLLEGFSEGTNWISSSPKTSDSSGSWGSPEELFLFTRREGLSIFPMSFLLKEEAFYRGLIVYARDEKQLQDVRMEMQLRFQEYGVSLPDWHNDFYSMAEHVNDIFLYAMVLMAALSFLSLLYLLSANVKALAVYRLQGDGLFRMGWALFHKLFLFLAGASLAVPCGLFLVRIHNVSPRALGFFIHICTVSLGLYLVFVIMVLILISVLSWFPLPHQLKRVTFHHTLNQITFVVCVLFSVLLLPSMETALREGVHGWLPSLCDSLQNQAAIREITYCEGLRPEAGERQYDELLRIRGETSEQYEEHRKLYRSLEKQNRVIVQKATRIVSSSGREAGTDAYLGYKINPAYFREQQFYSGGQRIELEPKGEEVYVLMDRSLYEGETWNSDNFSARGRETSVVLFDHAVFHDYFSWANPTVQYKKQQAFPIFILSHWANPIYPESIASGMMLRGESLREIEEILEGEGWSYRIKKNTSSLFE